PRQPGAHWAPRQRPLPMPAPVFALGVDAMYRRSHWDPGGPNPALSMLTPGRPPLAYGSSLVRLATYRGAPESIVRCGWKAATRGRALSICFRTSATSRGGRCAIGASDSRQLSPGATSVLPVRRLAQNGFEA